MERAEDVTIYVCNNRKTHAICCGHAAASRSAAPRYMDLGLGAVEAAALKMYTEKK